jgi:hypothetical protein
MLRSRVVVALTAAVVFCVSAPATADVRLPPVDTDLDYQLGGAKAMPAHVGILVRDRRAAAAESRYNVCYVNGFQTQPDERRFWNKRMPLVLKRGGRPVVDEAWGEWLLDLRTKAKRRALARIVGRWTERCAADGFAGVEYDNLDSFTRSHGLLKRRHAIAFARLLVHRAHAADLAAGQKNLAGFDGSRIGFDFAVAEECGRYRECQRYVASYGRRVLVIEYRKRDFRRACRKHADELAIVLRDRDLTPGGVHRWC